MFDRYGRHSFNQSPVRELPARVQIKSEDPSLVHIPRQTLSWILSVMRCWSPPMRVTRADRPCLSVDPHCWRLSDVTLASQWGTQHEVTRAPCSVAENTGTRCFTQSNWRAQNAVSVRLSKAPLLVKFSLCLLAPCQTHWKKQCWCFKWMGH